MKVETGTHTGLRPSAPARSPSREAFVRGLVQGLPIVAGYLPIGFAYGVIAAQSGLSPLEALAMSLIVFAGSAQFAAVGLLAGAASAGTLVATTFLINLRHALFGAALAPRLGERRLGRLALAAFGLTDEVFAVAQATLGSVNAPLAYLYGLEVAAYTSWCAASWLGATLGEALRGVEGWGLDYALPAMFLALIALQLGERRARGLLVAGVAAAVSLWLGEAGWARFQVLGAALVGSAVGVLAEWYGTRSSSSSS
ncbi:MAG TPA: AzlC family ABC transporter permease [Thermaerobacter sp.]